MGVSSRSESQRSRRQEFATSPRSSTTWSIDRSLRKWLAARPACPAPMTTVVMRSMAGPQLTPTAGQATSTVTFVGFVRASNTAERFWDWATSASMSSLDASASMVNVTLMSL